MSDQNGTAEWREPSAIVIRGNTRLVRYLAAHWSERGLLDGGDLTPSQTWLDKNGWLAEEWDTLSTALTNKTRIVVYDEGTTAHAKETARVFVRALRKSKARVTYLRHVKAPVIAQVVGSRKYSAARVTQMLEKPSKLFDPALLTGMDKTVDVIKRAIAEKRTIAVYGDFDCDGVTGCTILSRALRTTGAKVIPYIPNLENEGYGVHAKALKALGRRGVGLVITTDCGTSSVEEFAGRPEGMLAVVTDHHLPFRETQTSPEVLAPVDALVNPVVAGDKYPNKELSGSAVAWKVVCELEKQGVVPAGTAESLIGIAAIGTVGDVMNLDGENRTLVDRGLAHLQANPQAGVAALLKVARLDDPHHVLTAEDLAFEIIPRINAAGRMGDGQVALKLLLTDSPAYASRKATRLDDLNTQRKQLTKTAIAEAESQIAQLPADAPVFVVHSDTWRKGIVGAMAGRLAEQYNRPVVCIAENGADSKGSARSKGGVKIVNALRDVSGTMVRYGGHDYTAGFSIDSAQIPAFTAGLTKAVKKRVRHTVEEQVSADAVIASKDINRRMMDELTKLEPCGHGNKRPVFEILNAKVLHCDPLPLDAEDPQHWKVTLTDGTRGKSGEFKAVIWNDPGAHDQLMTWVPETESWTGGKTIDIRGTLAWNGWTPPDGEYRQYPQFTATAYRLHEPVAAQLAQTRHIAY